MTEFMQPIKQVLIAMFYNESQVGRSVGRNHVELKRKLFDAIMYLCEKADNSTLINNDIRDKIKEISKDADVSIGQSQKVINVYLKYYCILTNKPLSIIKELDCPLDSKIMNAFKTKGIGKKTLKSLDDFDEYVAWQNHLKDLGGGIRLKKDIETYDRARIRQFLSED